MTAWETLGALRVGKGVRVALISTGLPDFLRRHGPALALPVMVFSLARHVLRGLFLHNVAVRVVARRSLGRNLASLAALVEKGAITPVVDRVYPLSAIDEAHRCVETGRARGRVVIEVKPG